MEGAARPLQSSTLWQLVAVGLSLVTLSAFCCIASVAVLGTTPAALVVAGTLAVVVAPAYALYLLALDRLEHEPPWLLALAFLWGAGVAALGGGTATWVLQASTSFVLGLSSSASETLGTVLFAPVTEEIAKGLFVVLLATLARHEFDDVVDGIVYGGLVGLGFAVIEDFFYYAAMFLEEGLASTGLLFFVRGVLTGFNHSLYTAMTGLGLGLAVQTRSRLAGWLFSLGGLLFAILLHALWNGLTVLSQVREDAVLFLAVLLGYPVLIVVPLALLLGVIAFVQARRRSRDVERYLAAAVRRGFAGPDDVLALTRPWRRRARQWQMLWRYGWRAYWLRRRLDIALVDWAYRLWHRESGRALPKYLASYDAEALETRIAQWCAELAQILQARAR